jgi:mannose-6-phosphate isomerase-like protein (cupin superfamily)
MISRLLWSDVAPNRAFHAHLWHLNHRFLLHCHDFWEAFLVLKGGGTHLCNGRKETLKAGRLHLIRPDDTHSIVTAGSAYINIAWPAQIGKSGALWQVWKRALSQPSRRSLPPIWSRFFGA